MWRLIRALQSRVEPLACAAVLLLLGPLGLAALLLWLTARHAREFAVDRASKSQVLAKIGVGHPELDASLARLGAAAQLRGLVVDRHELPAQLFGSTIVMRRSSLLRLLDETGTHGLDAVLRHELAHSERHHLRYNDLAGHLILGMINVGSALLITTALLSGWWWTSLFAIWLGPWISEMAALLLLNALYRRLERTADQVALRAGHGSGLIAGLLTLAGEQDLFERARTAMQRLHELGATDAAEELRRNFTPLAQLSVMHAVIARAEAAAGVSALPGQAPRSIAARAVTLWRQLLSSHPDTASRIAACQRRLDHQPRPAGVPSAPPTA